MTSSFHINQDKEISFSEGTKEIKIPWNTKFYLNNEDTLTRFDNAYFLFWEQRHLDQTKSGFEGFLNYSKTKSSKNEADTS